MTPAAEKLCGSLLSYPLAPGPLQRLKLALPSKPSCPIISSSSKKPQLSSSQVSKTSF